VSTRLAELPQLSAMRLYEEIRAAGYPGRYTQLMVYVRQMRPRPVAQPVVRFETPAGQQNPGCPGGRATRWWWCWGIRVCCGCSSLSVRPKRWCSRGWKRPSGSSRECRRLLFDQMKAVIVEDHQPDGGRLLEHAEFARFTAHWGFRIRACRSYRAKTKGKVERPIGYVRRIFQP
jgi:transposase